VTARTAAKTEAPAPPHEPPLPPQRTEFSRKGLGYLLRIDEASTSIRLTRLKRRSDEITADILVRCRIEGVKTVDGILHGSRTNITSAPARAKLAELLHARTPGVRVDWVNWLDELAVRIMAISAEGDPITEVGHDAVDWSAPQYAVAPLSPLNEPGLLYGPGGSGKSLIALTLAIAVAAGRELLPGTTQHVKGPVLYLDWETSRQKVNRRIVSICAGMEIEVPRGIYYRRQNKPLADDAEELSAFVAEHKIVYVVIDSAAQAIGHQGDYGDANEGALKLFEGIRYLGQVSTLIVDHVSKQELVLAGKKGRVPYGSVYKINYSRAAWEIRPGEPIDGRLRLAIYDFKRNDDAEHPPLGLEMTWQPGSVAFAPADVAAIHAEAPPAVKPATAAEEASMGDKIFELLQGARMKAPAIASSLGLNGESVRTKLNKDPRFERESDGYWIVARDHLPL
jgi:hypothetical protein